MTWPQDFVPTLVAVVMLAVIATSSSWLTAHPTSGHLHSPSSAVRHSSPRSAMATGSITAVVIVSWLAAVRVEPAALA